jgi:hypothetical protein
MAFRTGAATVDGFGTERMRIDNAGNVGIGTTSPSETLEVGEVAASSTNYVRINAYHDEDAGIKFANTTGEVTKTGIVAEGLGSWNRADLHFVSNIAADHTNYTLGTDTRMLIDGLTGNVGIGTASPSYPLHVYRNTDSVQLARFEGAGSDYVDIFDYGIVMNRAATYIRNIYPDGDLTFITHNGTTTQNRIHIDGGSDSIQYYTHDGVRTHQWYTASSNPALQFSDSGGTASTTLYENPVQLGGTYGSLAIDGGATNSYEGVSIGGRVVFMHDNGTQSGLYDDVNNQWMFHGSLGGATTMHYAGVAKLTTANTGGTLTGVWNATTNLQEAGINLAAIYSPIITGAATTIVSSDLTINRALISNGSGKVAISAVTSTELGYLDGVTSAIQTQLDAKQATITGAATTITSSNLTTNRAVISNGSGKIAVSVVTSTELGYLDGVSSNIQFQINAKKDYFSENTAFNKNFAGTGSATTVSRSDHTHSAFEGLSVTIIDMGDWDMNTNVTKQVAHGLSDEGDIRSISIIIRNDTASQHYDFLGKATSTGGDGVNYIDGTNVYLNRVTAGAFDNSSFQNTSYNRGWITIWYVS